ncbi:MAG: glycosyltransferase, partial [Elusimicrobiota bacterium]|nr:glycosyltransferase [Elusimicrobiota bacterium]
PSDVPDYFKAVDVGLLPFDKKGFTDSACPIKLLEYTAAGKPVVSTDLEEVKRMDFSNVILVKDNPESLAEGIKKALNSKVEIPKKIENYDINKLAKEYEKVLGSG